MKNIITVAALLAAGTALANAATVKTTFENNATKTSYAYDSAVSVTNTWSDGTVIDDVVSTLTYGKNVKNVMYADGATGDFVAPWSGISGNPWTLTINYDNSATDAGHSLSVIDQIVLDIGAYANPFAWQTSETVTALGGNPSISFTATVRNTSSGASTALGTLSGTWNLNGTPDFSSYKLTLVTEDASAIDVSSVDSFSVALVTSCEDYTTAASSPAYGVGIRSIVIPEPSAFGLLAGLGALALVAARRRRKA